MNEKKRLPIHTYTYTNPHENWLDLYIYFVQNLDKNEPMKLTTWTKYSECGTFAVHLFLYMIFFLTRFASQKHTNDAFDFVLGPKVPKES